MQKMQKEEARKGAPVKGEKGVGISDV